MLKQVGKSVIWGILYIAASSFGVTIAMIFSIASNFEMFQLESDAFLEALMNSIWEAAIPGTFIAGIICIIAYYMYKVVFKHPFELKKIEFSKAIFSFFFGVTFNLIVTYILDFFWGMFPESLVESATEATSILDPTSHHWAFLLLAIGIVTPIGEEIIFRHGICRTLAKDNVSIGIILSALIFGVAHGNLIQGVYTFILGLICAVILINTDNLWYPILIHIGLNSSSVISSAVPIEFSNLTLVILGFTGLLICSTMLIHRDDIRAMVAKPNLHPDLGDSNEYSIPPEDAEERII